jgi:cytochrome c oxidase cbb3-type subunit 1
MAGLGLLVAWVPLARDHFRRFAWTEEARPWLRAAFVWWLLLVVTGWLTFLPGISERLKFTNGLVAHAHLAMAGLVTAVNFVVLRQLAPQAEPRGNFALWQGACAAHVVALLALGWVEAERAGELFRGEAWTQAIYGVRLAAGAGMLAASARWWRARGDARIET